MSSSGPRSAATPLASRWTALAFMALAQLMIALDATIVSIALPSAQRALGASDAERQWMLTAYALAFGCLLLLGGRVSDVIGRKAAFLIGLAGSATASAAGGAAPAFWVLVFARATQGASRRPPRADGALPGGGHLHRAPRAGQSLRDLRHDRRHRRRRGPGGGWRRHRVPDLAVVPLRQRADRAGGGSRRLAGAAHASAVPPGGGPVRRARAGARKRRPWHPSSSRAPRR